MTISMGPKRASAAFNAVSMLRYVGDVHHDALSLAFGTADIIDGFGQCIRAACTHGYTRSSRRKKGCKKASEATRAAGNQHMRPLD